MTIAFFVKSYKEKEMAVAIKGAALGFWQELSAWPAVQ